MTDLGVPLPVLLDVWAPWCVPGRGLESVIGKGDLMRETPSAC